MSTRITKKKKQREENKPMTNIGGSNLNKKALSNVQKPHHRDYDARILQPIPHDPVTFVNIISYEKKIKLTTSDFVFNTKERG